MSNLNKHLMVALDNYPYNMEECIEALNYALSSESQNALALCLMGRIYAEQFKQYEEAKSYFQEAMAADMKMLDIYPYYICTLIENEDYEEAERLLEFANTLKGIPKGTILWYKIYLAEKKGDYKAALSFIEDAICEGYNSGFIINLEEIEKRIKRKKEIKGKKKKKKESKNM